MSETATDFNEVKVKAKEAVAKVQAALDCAAEMVVAFIRQMPEDRHERMLRGLVWRVAAALYLEGMEMFFGKARDRLRSARTTADGAKALVRAYFDCAEADPQMVSFLIEARTYLDKTRYAAEIERKNAEFMPEVAAWFRDRIKARELREIAPDYIMAIIEGPARHYVKRWLASPTLSLHEAREVLAQAAWDALRRPQQERSVPRRP